jgi:4-amino-4-deoxy-L-arabinose transferase-like glycosyltransferase
MTPKKALGYPKPMPAMRQRTALWLAVGLAAALFAVRLGDDLYGDEAGHTFRVIAQGNLWQNVLDPSMCHPPLYFLLAKGCYAAFGALWAVRLPSVLAALAVIPLSGKLAGRCFGPSYVAPAAFLAAFSPFLHEFATEGRAYALMIFFATATLYAFVRFLEEETAGHGTWLVLAAVGGAWTHYFFYLFLAGLALYYLLQRRGVTKAGLWVAVATGFGAAPFPVLAFLVQEAQFRNSLQVNWIGSYFSPLNFLARLPVALAFGYSTFRLPQLDPGRTVGWGALGSNWLLGPATAVALAGIALAWILLWRKGERWCGLLFVGLAAPVLLGVLAGMSGLYLIREKHLAALWILLLLAVVRAFSYLREKRLWGWVPMACYGAVVAVSLCHFLLFPHIYSRRMFWSDLRAELERSVSAKDAVVLYCCDFHSHTPGQRVLRTNGAVTYRVADLVQRSGSVAAAARSLGDSAQGRIFLVSDETDRNGVDPDNKFVSMIQGGRDRRVSQFGRNLALYEFGELRSRQAGR